MEENEKTKDYTESLNENTVVETENIENTTELKDEFFEEKPKKKKIWLLILIILVVLCVAGVLVYFLVIKKPNNKKPDIKETDKIVRPENIEYTAIKQNPFGLYCNQTKSGEKIKTLTKNMIIECNFSFELKQRVSEVYFDLDTSSNIKLDEYKNDSEYTVETDGKTYKLSTTSPTAVFPGTLKFYYKVTKPEEQNGYLELKDVVFKDENDSYYKVLNNLTTIPPEYEDKLYIYESTYEEDGESGETYFFSSKTKYEEEKLYDTFQCKLDSCDEKSSFDNYFLILDDKLILYDTVHKTTETINTPADIDYEKYSYELMQTKDGKIYGIAFKQNYHDEMDCEKFEDMCVNLGLSGYDLGYYSLAEKDFTISLDYGFFGTTAYNEYDKALLLKKGNKYGIFSYEDDEMILDLTNKYTAMSYDSDLDLVTLELYDSNVDEYYYTLYDIDKKSFKVDVSKLNKLNSNLYDVTLNNRNGKAISLLYNEKGEQLKLLPYIVSSDFVQLSKFLTIKNGSVYDLYDFTGKFLYKSKYANPDILQVTTSYLLIINEDNTIELHDRLGNKIADIVELKTGVSFIKASETNKVLTLYVKDTAVEEEGKNGYKYTVNENGEVNEEVVNIN